MSSTKLESILSLDWCAVLVEMTLDVDNTHNINAKCVSSGSYSDKIRDDDECHGDITDFYCFHASGYLCCHSDPSLPVGSFILDVSNEHLLFLQHHISLGKRAAYPNPSFQYTVSCVTEWTFSLFRFALFPLLLEKQKLRYGLSQEKYNLHKTKQIVQLTARHSTAALRHSLQGNPTGECRFLYWITEHESLPRSEQLLLLHTLS